MLARRSVVKAMAGAPLAVVLASPTLARAAAAGLETVDLETAGGKPVSAALAVPARTPAPAVMLIHEWWGLNDQIKAVAAEFANQGYLALAIDLYDGKVAAKPEQARRYMGEMKAAEGVDTVTSWGGWLMGDERSTGALGTVGWCFGGGWSLNASLAQPVDGTVVYYGRLIADAGKLAALKGPVLGHYATRDRWINRDMVSAFEAAMDQAGRRYTSHWYEADHAFANPTSARYDEADARLAWERTMAFFGETLSA